MRIGGRAETGKGEVERGIGKEKGKEGKKISNLQELHFDSSQIFLGIDIPC